MAADLTLKLFWKWRQKNSEQKWVPQLSKTRSSPWMTSIIEVTTAHWACVRDCPLPSFHPAHITLSRDSFSFCLLALWASHGCLKNTAPCLSVCVTLAFFKNASKQIMHLWDRPGWQTCLKIQFKRKQICYVSTQHWLIPYVRCLLLWVSVKLLYWKYKKTFLLRVWEKKKVYHKASELQNHHITRRLYWPTPMKFLFLVFSKCSWSIFLIMYKKLGLNKI